MPTAALRDLAEADEGDVASKLKPLLEKHYGFLTAERPQPRARLRRTSRRAIPRRWHRRKHYRKAMAFYIAAAKAPASIKLSSHIKPPPVPKSTTPRRAPRNGGAEGSDVDNDLVTNIQQRQTAKTFHELLLQKFPEFDPTWDADVQRSGSTAFDELMKHGKKEGAAG